MSENNIQQKQRLLRTPVSELAMSETITNYFRWNKEGRTNRITLSGIFDLNQTIPEKGERLVVSADGRLGFTLESGTWKAFRRFLLDAGFTHKDWMMLVPIIMGQKDYNSLSKQQMKIVPLRAIYQFHTGSDTFHCLSAIFTKKNWSDPSTKEQEDVCRVTIGKLLQVVADDVYASFFVSGPQNKRQMLSPEQATRVLGALRKVQTTLSRDYLFDRTDGPFMSIKFEKIVFDKKGRMDPGQQADIFTNAHRPDAHTNNFVDTSVPTVQLNEKLLGP